MEWSFRKFRSKSWYLKHASGSTDYLLRPLDKCLNKKTPNIVQFIDYMKENWFLITKPYF